MRKHKFTLTFNIPETKEELEGQQGETDSETSELLLAFCKSLTPDGSKKLIYKLLQHPDVRNNVLHIISLDFVEETSDSNDTTEG